MIECTIYFYKPNTAFILSDEDTYSYFKMFFPIEMDDEDIRQWSFKAFGHIMYLARTIDRVHKHELIKFTKRAIYPILHE